MRLRNQNLRLRAPGTPERLIERFAAPFALVMPIGASGILKWVVAAFEILRKRLLGDNSWMANNGLPLVGMFLTI
ncbi:MAG: hypothetical protein ACREE6_09020 [Limisphaerales bacterium]